MDGDGDNAVVPNREVDAWVFLTRPQQAQIGYEQDAEFAVVALCVFNLVDAVNFELSTPS